MLKSLWQRWTILLVIIAIALSSCRQIFKPISAEANNQLVLAIDSDPKTFNSVMNNSLPKIFGYVDEGLVTEDGKGGIEPALAESWQIAPDGKQIIFTLKKNLKWSDGQPLTIDDIMFTFGEVYFNPKIPSDAQDGFRIGKERKLPTVKKLDDDRVEFTTPEPFAPFLLALGAGILPAHKLRATVHEEDSNHKPKFMSAWGINTKPKDLVSSGMFILDSYTPGERLIFKKNPNYWRKDKQGVQLPYIDRIIWQIVESPDTALVQFRSGDLDAIGASPSYFSLLKKDEKKGDYKVYNGGPSLGTSFMFFNLNRGERDGKPLVDPIKSRWFNNVKFRQAIAYGIDRQRMITNIYRGLGAPQDSPITVSSPYFLSRQQGLPVYDYNPKKARELLLSTGFKYDAQNKLIDEDGNQVIFTLIAPAESKGAVLLGTQIKQDLDSLGIELNFTPIAWSLMLDRTDGSLNWDAAMMGFTGSIEPNDGANVWSVEGALHSFNLNPKKGKPIQNHQVADWEKKIDELYIQGAQELNNEKRRKIYFDSQVVTQENLPYIYLVNPFSLSAVKNNVRGINYSSKIGIKDGGKSPFWNLYELRVSAE